MGPLDYILAGVAAAFATSDAAMVFGAPLPIAIMMVAIGFLAGVAIGATPGLSGPFAMAISLPILISIFGVNADALLPVLGFLIGVMKGATVGGAVPAILFNTPGTPDALMTTLDGYPMTQRGQSNKALRVAHLSSASGDTFSDLVLFTTAPFLAIVVEAHLGFVEKAALILLSLSFIAAAIGRSVLKGLLSASFGLFVAFIASGEDPYPRLSLETGALREGVPIVAAVIGVLILGEVFKAMEDLRRERRQRREIASAPPTGRNRLGIDEIRSLAPHIGASAAIGTLVGVLPGIGSTLAATIGYSVARGRSKTPEKFGRGAPEGVAATEAANSAVSGANLIPVLSLGIPGNVAAVFIILAMESISGFNPGPSVFHFNAVEQNTELVMVFGLFTLMIVANVLNWTIGRLFMRATGVMAFAPRQYLLPVVVLITLTSVYVEKSSMSTIYFALAFGVLGYLMRRLEISVLPFVIAFILADNLETALRQAFSVSGADPFFLFKSPIALAFLALSAAVVFYFGVQARRRDAEHIESAPK